MNRLLKAIIACFALVTTAPYSAAGILDAAVNYLAATGNPVPPGYTVSFGDADGHIASTNPNPDGTGGTIEINPDKITEVTPGITEGSDPGGVGE